VLFGAERPEQVAENLSSFAESAPPKLCEAVRKAFPDLSEEILDPARWPKEQEGRPTREVGQ
jgi:hypothetical protein